MVFNLSEIIQTYSGPYNSAKHPFLLLTQNIAKGRGLVQSLEGQDDGILDAPPPIVLSKYPLTRLILAGIQSRGQDSDHAIPAAREHPPRQLGASLSLRGWLAARQLGLLQTQVIREQLTARMTARDPVHVDEDVNQGVVFRRVGIVAALLQEIAGENLLVEL